MQDHGALRALQLLLRSVHLAGADALPGLAAAAGAELGARDAVVLLIDYDQVALVPLVAAGEPAESIPVEGTLAGRTYSEVAQHVSTTDDALVVWSPILDGTARIGVLAVTFGEDVDVDDELRAACLDVAALLAELIQTRSAYGDLVERTRRRAGMTLAAELQWRQLPPLTFVSPRAAIAGTLAPAAEVAGDSFDYAVNGSTVHVAVLDAMGHGMEAALLSAVAVAAYRNTRRSGDDLVATVQTMEAAISAHFGPASFVTGIIGELDLETGLWAWATCGHHHALLVRAGRVVKELDHVTNPPLGLGLLGDGPQLGRERLEPGDRLVFYTDGVIEARDESGAFFGVERLIDLLSRQAASGRPVAETLRRLTLAILDHQHGALQDDATAVILEWLTDEPSRVSP